MRNLTIRRNKAFAASLAKLQVYIEDPAQIDLMISEVPCRKLGTLKNGEEKTFSIPEQAARIFVIADKLSRNYSNDFYPLEEGTEDVTLTGGCRFDLGSGNAFRFDGVAQEAVLANRKKGTKKGIVVMIAAAILGFVVGIASNLPAGDKDFTAEGMTITLTSDFDAEAVEGYTQCYDAGYMAVFTLKEPFSLGEGFGDYTLEEYAQLVLEANGLNGTQVVNGGDFLCFTHTYSEDGENITYFTTLHKGSDAFWLVEFMTWEENFQDLEADFLRWADTVRFE